MKVFRVQKYIFKEIMVGSLWGSLIAIIVLISLQALRLSRRVIQLDLDYIYIIKIIFGLALGFLPIVLPIAFLIAMLVIFGKMATDGEFISMQSVGYSPKDIVLPVVAAGCVFAVLTLWVSFDLGPYGYKSFQKTLAKGMGKRIASVLRPGAFNEDFLDMVVYVNGVDGATQEMEGVFIHDSKNFKKEVAITAKRGQWSMQDDKSIGVLTLNEGTIISYDSTNDILRTIYFDQYKLNAEFKIREITKRLSPTTYSWSELKRREKKIKENTLGDPKPVWIEVARRFALAFFCLFAIPLCFALNIKGGRTAKNRAILLSIVIAGGYWMLYSALMTYTLRLKAPVFREYEIITWALIWIPNFILLTSGMILFKIRTSRPAKD